METEIREHASIDIEKLAASLTEVLGTSHPLSAEACIFRVPQHIRSLNPSAYTPQVISIGPLHYGKPDLKVMEEYKIRYLHHFLQRTRVTIKDFLAFIKNNEVRMRNCYAETIELDSNDFVKMILVDAVFVLEYFLRFSNHNFASNDDPRFTISSKAIEYELLLLENQLPFFILEGLFNLAKTETCGDPYQELSLFSITCLFLKNVLDILHIKESLLEIHSPEAKNFLDLLLRCLQPSPVPTENTVRPKEIPTINELHLSEVEFQSPFSNNIFDIKFKEGILEIPVLRIDATTAVLFRNLLVWEKLNYRTCYINDYLVIMNYLVKTTKDAELLIQKGVVINFLRDSESVSTLLGGLFKETTLQKSDFHYSGLVDNLKNYCQNRVNRWKFELKTQYFTSPWISISVVQAVIILILTFLQAIYPMIRK